jgi:prepilin-type N-terminal cleavage/methylation domain-containing protein/prepilin-type processing-associated H-X9-DG protein
MRRSAFTLVELLVVIAIIGVLVALLLPAVQAAREAARRMQCANNLKQLGLGLHNYHDVHKRFPPGASHGPAHIWGDRYAGHHGSFLARMLPFIEEQNLFNNINPKLADPTMDSAMADGTKVYQVKVATFICPSDETSDDWNGDQLYHGTPVSMQGQRAAQSNYGASMGNQYFAGGPFLADPARFQGASDHGHDDTGQQISGVFGHTAFGASIAEIRDGTSKTIALGEVRPKCSWHVRDGWMHWNSLWIATTTPINYPSCPNEPGFDSANATPLAGPKWAIEQAFRSSHPGGCHFLLADGSVHFLTETIDYETYQRLGARRDGLTVEGF